MLSAVAFALFALVCSILAFKRHPIYGLYFYLATTYIHPPSRWWNYMLPDLRWAFLSAAVTILAVWLHRGKLQKRPPWVTSAPILIVCTYAGWMWLQSAWALDLPTHLTGTVLYTKYLVACWFIYRVTDTKDGLRNLLLLHSLGCGMVGVLAHFAGRDGGRLENVGGSGIDDANTLAMFLATGVIVSLGLVLAEKGWRRWVALVCLACAMEGFVLANSRGALLGLAAGWLVLALCKARAHRKVFWSFGIAAVLLFGLAVDKAFVERMSTMGDVAAEDEEGDASARSRVAIIEAQGRMARDYPLGAGHRGTVALSTRYLDRRWLVGAGYEVDAGRASHNTFMTTLVEQGVLGATLFLTMAAWLFVAGLRLRRLNRGGIDPQLLTLGATMCATIIIVLVAGVATDYLLAEVQFWMLGGLASMLQLARVRELADEQARLAGAPAQAGMPGLMPH